MRTRLLLQISVVLLIAATTAMSLLIVRSRLRQHVRDQLDADLRHSLMTYQDLQGRRRTSLERENQLLATLPTLRSLMTTHDARTIEDGAQYFWKQSGNELFALADAERHIMAADASGVSRTALRTSLEAALASPAHRYLFVDGHLFEYSVTPIYFGSADDGTMLGYLLSGYAVDHELLREVGRGAGAEVIFLVNGQALVGTLPAESLGRIAGMLHEPGPRSTPVRLGRTRYLTITRDLSGESNAPLRLAVLKSFDSADQAERDISRIVAVASLIAIAVGCVLMLLLARFVTAPLEHLAEGVKAFAGGDREFRFPTNGPREVRYLSQVLAEMRDEIQRKSRALLEAERLATIGRMANSVSHDLRHYLAAIYANSEFLASPTLPAEERAELLEEIRLAVDGTTDMLDALLLFGSSGASLRRAPASMAGVVERAIALVRAHPDAAHVILHMNLPEEDSTAFIDGRQIERAVYNLLLNACQSAAESAGLREVEVTLRTSADTISVLVTDTGGGVPDGIRYSLFDPFVSKGKQKGIGLGLTLAYSVAQEHKGSVELVSSRPGETIFCLTVQRAYESEVSSEEAAMVMP